MAKRKLFKNGTEVTDENKIKEQVSEFKDTGSFAEGFEIKELPKPTVATKEQPIVQRGVVDTAQKAASTAQKVAEQPEQIEQPKTGTDEIGEVDMRVTKIGEVLSDEEKRTIIDKERDKIREMENVSFEDRNKMFRKLTEDIQSGALFGGETQLERERAMADAQRKKVQESAGGAIDTAEQTFRQEVESETRRIKEQGQRVMDTTQRLNSLRGAGRSSANEELIQQQQSDINGLIEVAEQQAKLRLEQRRMQIEGAEAEALSSINEALTSNEALLNERIATAQATQLELNNQIGATSEQSMETMLEMLSAGGEDVSGINQEKSNKLGYFVNQDGSIYLNNAGNPVEFKTILSDNYTSEQIDAFAKGIAGGDLKFGDLDLDNQDVALVIQAMNSKMDDVPGLSVNSLKAERILKDLGLGTDEESVKTVTNLLKGYSEKEVRNMVATDEFKNGTFVAGNQKLFDDLRKDAQSFKDIDRTYNGMRDIWDDFKNNPSDNRAAMEQALIIMFNKMLDPGSVVREGEFDRTSQGQSVINSAEGWLQKLAKGGAGIKNEAFEDIVNITEVLYDASKDTVRDLKSSYKGFATDLGADPDFVDRFFETGFELGTEINTSGTVDDIYSSLTGQTQTTTTEINKGSSFEEKANFLDSGFNSGDQTSQTKEIGSGVRTQNYGDKSPLAVDNVKLVNGTVGTPGVDIDGKIGDPIPSTVNGIVKVIKSKSGLGNRVIVIDEQGNEHYFSHLDGFNVKDGQKIKKGQQIGTMGNTGNVIAGPGGDGSHLDYRVKSKQGWEDPNKFLIG